jgi:bifunctional non-homologous end joining protein LigD
MRKPTRKPAVKNPERIARKPRPDRSAAQHAFVGGWSQWRGDFVGLLLGVRQGRQRKLTYIGEVATNPRGLEMTLLEPRLREIEVETSPFLEPPTAQRDHAHHWTDPDLVAEIEFDSWTRDHTISRASLRAVTGRPSFRNAKWAVPPR